MVSALPMVSTEMGAPCRIDFDTGATSSVDGACWLRKCLRHYDSITETPSADSFAFGDSRAILSCGGNGRFAPNSCGTSRRTKNCGFVAYFHRNHNSMLYVLIYGAALHHLKCTTDLKRNILSSGETWNINMQLVSTGHLACPLVPSNQKQLNVCDPGSIALATNAENRPAVLTSSAISESASSAMISKSDICQLRLHWVQAPSHSLLEIVRGSKNRSPTLTWQP